MKKRIIKLTGDALKEAQALHAEVRAIHGRADALREEFDTRMAELEAEKSTVIRNRWGRIMDGAGLVGEDPNAWGLDAQYSEPFGLMFLNCEGEDSAEPFGRSVH